jgi:uncharacterized protein (DUF885 family)
MKRLLIASTIVLAASCSTNTKTPSATGVAPAPAVTTPASTPSSTPSSTPPPSSPDDDAFRKVRDAYVVELLRRYPAISTYLGGSGLDPSLREADGRLRDFSEDALAGDDHWLSTALNHFEAIAASTLSPEHRIDFEVASAQIHFLLHQRQIRRYQQRALDTYTDEPFRAVDFELQGMTETGTTTYGTAEEWSLVALRLADIPRYLHTAQEQLTAGIRSGNTPDFRMLFRNGITTSEADAKYFEETLPQLAARRITGPRHDELTANIRERSKLAAAAYREMGAFIARTFFDNARLETGVKPQFAGDRFAVGEPEYNWSLHNNLRIEKSASQLFAESWPIVEGTQRELVDLARQIGSSHGWTLPADGNAAVRAVFDELSKDYPKNDAEMIDRYRQTALRLVDYSRKTGLFDVPTTYKLEVVQTPPPLEASIDGAAYYPAPPFKDNGVGRFYISPTHDDTALLQQNNRAALADLAAHEGFPGHDWYYKVQTRHRKNIPAIRWLTPGSIEDSSSMWEDSMAAEGWALYSESLMAEPAPGAPNGFYTPEERLYQLQGELYRDLRVRLDTGLHTGRLKYDDAVDLYSSVVDFLPGSCRDAAAMKNDSKRASCTSAEGAIFRYSKWPTQAITYRMGKDDIVALRDEARQKLGPRFSLKQFHLALIEEGDIPVAYIHDELLRKLMQ